MNSIAESKALDCQIQDIMINDGPRKTASLLGVKVAGTTTGNSWESIVQGIYLRHSPPKIPTQPFLPNSTTSCPPSPWLQLRHTHQIKVPLSSSTRPPPAPVHGSRPAPSATNWPSYTSILHLPTFLTSQSSRQATCPTPSSA